MRGWRADTCPAMKQVTRMTRMKRMKRATTIRQRPVFSIVMVAALAVLLPLLAVLQYRWIGQVSEAEGASMRQTLNFATVRSVRDITDELEQVVQEFNVRQGFTGRTPFTEELLADFTRQLTADYENWQATSLSSALLRSVYVHNRVSDEYRRFDPVTNTLVEARPPIARFERWFDNTDGVPSRFLSGEEFAEGALWLVADVIIGGGRRQRNGPFAQPVAENRLLFEIDPRILWDELVPGIMTSRFEEMDYRVAVEDSTSGRLLYASDPAISAEIIGVADANQPIAPRTRQFRLIGSEIRVVAQHELGSLAAAVASARQRNLAIGFGILTLLGVAGGMIIVWSERVRSVGRLQMEFAAGISHELRTPLATIRTAAHNIGAGIVKSPEQIREYAGIVQSEGRRLSAMVDQAIQFAQTEAGRRSYDLHPVGVDAVIERAVHTALPSAEEGGHRIEVNRHPDLPEVMADETALTHSLVNLLTNAIKFGDSGRPITIEAAREDKGRRVRISVLNSGPGIDADELGNLFEPFYRGRNTSHIPGSGLGLSLVRRMMEGQQGQVTVETSAGQGATFTLHIPVAPAGLPEPVKALR